MKRIIILFFMLSFSRHDHAQIKWSEPTRPSEIEWNNYSTTFLGSIDKKEPILVAAIPYNGTYGNMDGNTAFDMDFSGSLFRYRSPLSRSGQQLYTYDSGAVYFLTPGIFKENAADYEYRIVLNAKTELVPWHNISEFSDLQLNDFKKGFAFLGGYKTSWGNFISAEIRKKQADSSFALTTVYWKETKPVVTSVFTNKNLNEFFSLLQRPWSSRSKGGYPPQQLEFSASENTIIFYLSAEVFKKEALEYKLLKNGQVLRDWKQNDYDNNFIWLKDLSPGKYEIEIRYRRQRQNSAGYRFEIKPQWHQTTFFKIFLGSLIAAFIGFIILVFRNAVQKRKLRDATIEKEKIKLRLAGVQSQLNPHFVFNALNSIQWLINKNDPESASRYLATFSSLLRNSLRYNESEFIAVNEEAGILETYLSLEKLRFPINYKVIVAGGLEHIDFPGFLLQPLVENSVKHGYFENGQLLDIDVIFFRTNDNLCVSVVDNGKGFSMVDMKEGYGLKLTKERIHLLNQEMGERHIKISIESAENKGTAILLTFTNWLK